MEPGKVRCRVHSSRQLDSPEAHVQSTPFILKICFSVTLPSTLGLPSGLYPSGLSTKCSVHVTKSRPCSPYNGCPTCDFFSQQMLHEMRVAGQVLAR